MEENHAMGKTVQEVWVEEKMKKIKIGDIRYWKDTNESYTVISLNPLKVEVSRPFYDHIYHTATQNIK